MDKQYLMVRAMTSQEIHFREFFDNSVVAIGWSDIDFTQYGDREELIEAITSRYYVGKRGPQVSRNLNECRRFKRINAGDLIIIPYNNAIALAEAEAGELYSKKAWEIDLANQHKVAYRYKDGAILSVPRKNLSEGLQRRLRVPGSTVLDLSEFSDEIDKLFADPESYSYSSEAQQKEDALTAVFKQELLKNIQSGKTNLQTGGIGMEQLVRELFTCEGYTAQILPKSEFEGSADADIKAWKGDYFSSVSIFAQVKHHGGFSGRHGIDQVIEAVKLRKEQGEDFQGVFVTSAKVSKADEDYARDNNIMVIDGEKLVDIIYFNIDKLSDATKKKLGIVMVPSIFNL